MHLQLMRMRTSGGREVRLDVGLIRRVSVASGNGTALIVGCGATALFDLHTTHFPAKFAPHISLSINGFVTETIVFFYICLNLFLRYLWLALAFSAVRFSVHGINRSDIHLFLRFFFTKCIKLNHQMLLNIKLIVSGHVGVAQISLLQIAV
ncbi:hypothetical protein [Escherichia coli]|uniref:hypothetical protein n=1 Tax=Escherichia coli TaxID=562 RepID=UPI0015F1334A|nr:hypothetical protein [Escherichia coli]